MPDLDSANYDAGSLRAQITAGAHTGDTLSIATTPNILVTGSTVSFDADGAGAGAPVDIGTLDTGNTETDIRVNLNASADDAAVKALTEAFRYFTASQDPGNDTRTVTFTLVDGGGTLNSGHDTTSFTANVAVTPSNDKPVVDLDADDNNTVAGAYKAFYIPAGAAVPVTDADVSILDPDNANITSATITISNAQANDLLSASGLPGGIAVSGASTATNLILTGSATKAAYETALHQVQFSNTNTNPDTTTRDITVVVSDGTALSDKVHTSIVVNSPPSTPNDTDVTPDAVTEGATEGTSVGIDVDSTDPELAGAITYSLSTNPGGFFAIDSDGK